MWLPSGKRRRTARAPKRLIRRSINGSAAAFPFPCVSEVCAGAKRLGHERGKRHEVDAEAHVERLDLVLDEAQEMLGLARGGAQACLDHGRGAVGAGDPKREAPAAAACARKLGAKRAREMVEAGQDALMGDERLREGKPRHEVGRGKQRDARLFAAAERLIEATEHGLRRFLGMEPPLETRARQSVKLADALKPEPLQQRHDLGLEPQGLDGKGRERGLDLSVRDDDRETLRA